MMSPKPLRIFCSYAHEDEEHLDELRTTLRGLERQGLIEWWHDREIVPGWEWEEDIDKNLRTAELILLLVTPDFMSSDYVFEKEIDRAIERHQRGEARVIPIIVRPADWEWAPFGKLQALPKDAKPITTWLNQDEAWLDVVRGIRKAVEKRTSEPPDEPPDEQGGYLPLRYREGLELAWADEKLNKREVEWLKDLAKRIGLSSSTAAGIERQIMGATKEAILEGQERENRLTGLYDQARQMHQNKEWRAVVDVFSRIHSEEADYPDREGLLASAREALEALEEMVKVPDLSGQEVSQASSTLANEGLELGARNEIWSATVPKGQIIEQRPVARTEVEAGSLVSITVSLGPQPELPALAGGAWWLFLRGLVLAIFGLALLVIPTALNDPGSGFFRLASAIVMILDWVFATIDAKTRADHRRWLLIQGRISLGLGLFTFVTLLLAWLTIWQVPSLPDIELELARYLVGLWAIVIGSVRIGAAIQLRWETKYLLLMGANGGLLIFFGMGAWVLPTSRFWWSPLGYLALLSGITLIALLWVWNRERSGAVE
jgi:TIR domain/PASTA domain